MAGMIKGIFGLLPAGVRAEQGKEQKDLAALMVRRDNTNPAVAKFGADFGAELGRGLLSRFGIEDPKMAEAMNAEQQETELNEKIAALDPDDPRRQYLLAEALSKMGDTRAALAAYASGRQMAQYKSQLAEQDSRFEYNTKQDAAKRRTDAVKMYAELSSRGVYSPEQIKYFVDSAFPGLGLEFPDGLVTDNNTGGPPPGTNNNTGGSGTNNNKEGKKKKKQLPDGSGALGDTMGEGDAKTINVGMDENGEGVYQLVSSLTVPQIQEIRKKRTQMDASKNLDKIKKGITTGAGKIVDYITNPKNEDRSKIF